MATPDIGLPRWQGAMEAKLEGTTSRVTDLEKAQHGLEERIVALQVQVASLKTAVGIWAAIGGVLGAGVVSLIGALVGGHA